MTATKREHHDSEPDSSEVVKKPKMEYDGPHSPTLQSKAGVIQGPDDASIDSLFSALFYAINTFVQDYFKGAPYSIARKNDEKAFFESLTGTDCKGYLKSKHPGAKEAIMMAAIWNKLINSLLRAPTRAFIDSIPETKIRIRTSDAKEEFYAWRTLTAHFLSKNYKGPTSWGENGPEREEFVEELASLLLDHSVVKAQDKLQSGLDSIADHAFQLATAIARSRAYWVCAMKDPRDMKLHGFKIKNDRMEDVDLWDENEGHGKSTIVDLVKTPMLLKFGNSSGEDFDKCQVVKKAEVVVKAKKATD